MVRHVLFHLPYCWASRKPVTSVEFKFIARQVEASVVIRAAKLKFESTLCNMFPSTCNIEVCCEKSWSQTWQYAQQRVSTCNATMLRDKLKKNVARITGL